MYEYARENKRAGRPAGISAQAGETRLRSVAIHEINIVAYQYPRLTLRIRCGTGTYIRSLARDLGEKIRTGAYVSSLCRTRVGPFDIKSSVSLNKLSTAFPQYLSEATTLISHLPHRTLTSHNIKLLRQGMAVPWPEKVADCAASVAIVDETNQLLGIATWNPSSPLLSPRINL